MNAIVPLESLVLVNTGAPSKGLYVAVTVTSLPGTVKELLAVVADLSSITSEKVHSLKGMSVPSELFFSLGLMFTLSPARKYPLLFAYLTPGPVSWPFPAVTLWGVPKR